MSEDLLGRVRTLTEALHSRVQGKGDRESLIVLDRERGELPLTLAEFWERDVAVPLPRCVDDARFRGSVG